jgi:Tol biopolymer transport system component
MRLERLDRIALAVLSASALAVAGMLWVDRALGVRVARTIPLDRASIAAVARIGLEFREAMQTDSVEAVWSMEPGVAGRFQWEGMTLWFTPQAPLEPGIAYRVRIHPGARAESGRVLRSELGWQFSVRQPRALYLAPASSGPELWIHPLDGEARPLTATGGQVFDYGVSRDGEWIAFSQVNAQGGIDLWLIRTDGQQKRLLVDCGTARCTSPDWSPDGVWIAYSREEALAPPASGLGPPRVWTVRAATGETLAVYQDSQILGYGPSWSPDGSRLASFDGNVGGIRILEIATGREEVLPTQMGLVGSWAPTGAGMLFNVMELQGETPIAGLLYADFSLQQVTRVPDPGGEIVDYGPPSWSPAGDWVMVGIQSAQGGPGRQLWLMRPDGSEAHPAVIEPQSTAGAYRWDPWGRSVVFQRLQLGVANATPEIWLWQASDESTRRIASDATLPRWLP